MTMPLSMIIPFSKATWTRNKSTRMPSGFPWEKKAHPFLVEFKGIGPLPQKTENKGGRNLLGCLSSKESDNLSQQKNEKKTKGAGATGHLTPTPAPTTPTAEPHRLRLPEAWAVRQRASWADRAPHLADRRARRPFVPPQMPQMPPKLGEAPPKTGECLSVKQKASHTAIKQRSTVSYGDR